MQILDALGQPQWSGLGREKPGLGALFRAGSQVPEVLVSMY